MRTPKEIDARALDPSFGDALIAAVKTMLASTAAEAAMPLKGGN
jgi:hypothetical protein